MRAFILLVALIIPSTTFAAQQDSYGRYPSDQGYDRQDALIQQKREWQREDEQRRREEDRQRSEQSSPYGNPYGRDDSSNSRGW